MDGRYKDKNFFMLTKYDQNVIVTKISTKKWSEVLSKQKKPLKKVIDLRSYIIEKNEKD